MSMLKLPKEANVIFTEHSQILDHVFEVSDAFNSHAKSIAGINRAVYTAKFKNIGIYHAASQNLYPTGVLAETASLTSAQHT